MKTDEIYFIRWGNLNPIKHKEARGTDEDTWIHVAPCYKGIYAFPRGFIEEFLIGGEYGQHHKRLLRDKDGNPIPDRDFYTPYLEKVKPEYAKILKKLKIKKRDLTVLYINDEQYTAYNVRPKKFKYNGDIWHHLEDSVDKDEIIDSKHGWIKTSFKAYVKALRKRDTVERFHSYLMSKDRHGDRHGDPHTHPNWFVKDYYEVFIEHIK